MIELLFNPNDYEFLIYCCEVLFLIGLCALWYNENHKSKLDNLIKPKWLFSIGGLLITLLCVEFYIETIITYSEKGLLKVWNIPQVFNFLVQEIKAEQGDTFINTISFDRDDKVNHFSEQKHIFIFDRTGSQIENRSLDNTENGLRKKIVLELRKICSKNNYNDDLNTTFLNNLKYGELMFLYTIIITHQNAGKEILPIKIITYLGHNNGKINIKYLNKGSNINEKCVILDSCLSAFKVKPQFNHKSFYSLFLEQVYKNNLEKADENTILTLVGDFVNDELDSKNNKIRYEKNSESLVEILKKIYKLNNIKQIRTVILPISKIEDTPKFQKTFQKFPYIFEKKIKKIRLDSLGNDLDNIISELSDALNSQTIIARYKRKENLAYYCGLYFKGGRGKKFIIKNLCHSMISIQDTPIWNDKGYEILLESDTMMIQVPTESFAKLNISQNGLSIPIDVDLIEFTPKYIAMIVLVSLSTLFSLFFFGFLNDVYGPLHHNYKYHHRIKIPWLKRSINSSDNVAFWASMILIIYTDSILQIFQLFGNNKTIFYIILCIIVIPFFIIFWERIIIFFKFKNIV